MKFMVIGLGYVGMSLATIISTKYEVYAIDLDSNKIDLLNNKRSPIGDHLIQQYLDEMSLKLHPSIEIDESALNSDFAIIATPTDYDDVTNEFNTKSIESVIENLINNGYQGTIVIKSTVPIGYTKRIQDQFKNASIHFSPEFLREGSALLDNLNPSRIIVSPHTKKAEIFGDVLASVSENKDIKPLFMDTTEAEAVKLFSNTYLAMRVSFFNELDSFAEMEKLNSKDIIDGMGADPRIGSYYNNPSFGYGGYCLPKDTKQMLSNFHQTPNSLIGAIVEANQVRKQFIVDRILERMPSTVGIYKLAMKSNSDNFRSAAVFDIINLLISKNINVIIYEPSIHEAEFQGHQVVEDFIEFANTSDVILTNRNDNQLQDFKDKVYSRDIFNNN